MNLTGKKLFHSMIAKPNKQLYNQWKIVSSEAKINEIILNFDKISKNN